MNHVGRIVVRHRILDIESSGIEGSGTHESLLAILVCGELPSHLDKVVTGMNDWNLCDCGSEELVKRHWLLVVVSQVGVCFGEKSPQVLSRLTRPHTCAA